MSEEKDLYKIPEWAGKLPQGTHLDVTKNGKIMQVAFFIIAFLTLIYLETAYRREKLLLFRPQSNSLRFYNRACLIVSCSRASPLPYAA